MDESAPASSHSEKEENDREDDEREEVPCPQPGVRSKGRCEVLHLVERK